MNDVDVRNIEFRAQMWEHNAEVNDLTWTKNNPMFGGSTTEHLDLCRCSTTGRCGSGTPTRTVPRRC